MSYDLICVAFMYIILVWKTDICYKGIDSVQSDCVVFGIFSETVSVFKRNKMSLVLHVHLKVK